MNGSSPLLLIGIGGAGSAMARGVSRAFGDTMRFVMVDTDAVTGQSGANFLLLGGDRLSGHGTGGDIVSARLAAEDSADSLDPSLEGVRLAVIVTALGGGTGGGATLVAAKHLSEHGIPSVVFATTPFSFEGAERHRNADDLMPMIEDAASTTFFIPLDKLVSGTDNMNDALKRAVDTLSSGVTLFWRLVEKPGYIRLDAERLRHVIAGTGRGRFATVTAQGPNRAADAVDALRRSELLSGSSGPVKSLLCGILAGDDLLLSEVGHVADGLRQAFGGNTFDLATVNDEQTFSGRLSVVVLLFESAGKPDDDAPKPSSVMSGRRKKAKAPLNSWSSGRSRFKNVEPTIWNGEDLDVPTFIRKNLNLDF